MVALIFSLLTIIVCFIIKVWIGGNMKKITILALHLGYGGIEKCIAALANSLADTYKVEILAIYKLYEEPAFYIDPRVHIRYLSKVVPNKNDFKYALKRVNIFKIIKEAIKALNILRIKRKVLIDAIDVCDSDIIISTRDYTNKYLGEYRNAGVRAIGWEHNHPHGDEIIMKKVRNSCKHLDELVVVSKELKHIYSEDFKKNDIKCQVEYIPNFLETLPKKVNKLDNKNIISVGRLEPEKGFLDLVSVFKLMELKDGEVYLNLVGDGSQKDKIFKNIVDNNNSRKVSMHGYLDFEELNKLYEESSLYLMTSYTESFGLVLIEAMSHGIPVIAFSCAEGARELINNGVNGYLIKNRNEHEMTDKALKLLNNPEKLKKMGENARATAMKYSKDEVKKMWIKLLG